MGVFDKEAFMSQTQTGAMETKFTPIPVNEYKNLVWINDVAIETFKDTRDNIDKPQLHITLKFADDKLAAELGMKEVTHVDRLFIDYDEKAWADGKLVFLTGPNKNVKLGMYRAAAKQNDPKKPWSPIMLKGAGPLAAVKVSQRNANDGSGRVYAQIDRVA